MYIGPKVRKGLLFIWYHSPNFVIFVEWLNLNLKKNCCQSIQAGNYIRSDVVTVTIQLIAETTGLHADSVQQLFRAMQTGYAQQPLAQVACWCIGEYGDQIFSSSVEDEEPLQVGFICFISISFFLSPSLSLSISLSLSVWNWSFDHLFLYFWNCLIARFNQLCFMVQRFGA